MDQRNRNIGLDLLRSISMLMIVTLHYLAKGGVLWNTTPNTFLWYFVWFIEALCLISVNCYVLISAYFLTDSKQVKMKKVIGLWAEMLFYSVSISVILALAGVPLSIKDIIYTIFPFLTKSYWFINTYILMYLLHPFINKVVWSINKNEFQRLLIILIVFFSLEQSILPFPEMTLDQTGGYGIIWFVVLYFVGAYIKRYETEYQFLSGKINCVIFFGSGILLLLSRVILSNVLLRFGFDEKYADIWYSYNSIPVFVASIAIFLTFLNIEIIHRGSKRLITKMGGATLGVYLIHEQVKLHQILWKDILKVDKYYNSSVMIINMIVIVIGVFGICILIEMVRSVIVKKMKEKFRKVES